MKKITVLLLAFFISLTGYAQKLVSGSLAEVFRQETLNVAVDYSKASIDGIKESSLLNIGGERAKDWQRDKEEINSKFILALHLKINDIIEVGRYPDANYTLVFIPTSFDDDGEVNGYAEIIDTDGTSVAKIEKINGDGGRWGSFTNLCGDAMERAGENVGKLLQRECRKIRTNR